MKRRSPRLFQQMLVNKAARSRGQSREIAGGGTNNRQLARKTTSDLKAPRPRRVEKGGNYSFWQETEVPKGQAKNHKSDAWKKRCPVDEKNSDDGSPCIVPERRRKRRGERPGKGRKKEKKKVAKEKARVRRRDPVWKGGMLKTKCLSIWDGPRRAPSHSAGKT